MTFQPHFVAGSVPDRISEFLLLSTKLLCTMFHDRGTASQGSCGGHV
jgi:hypothetical protein